MEIRNPRRLLVLGHGQDSGILTLLKGKSRLLTLILLQELELLTFILLTDLTGSTPILEPSSPTSSHEPPQQQSLAGLSHEYEISTPYYKATVPIWIDEIVAERDKKIGDTGAASEEVSKKDKEDEGLDKGDILRWKEEFMKEEAGEVVKAVQIITHVLQSIRSVIEHHLPSFDGTCLAVLVPHVPTNFSQAPLSTSPLTEDDIDDVSLHTSFELLDLSLGATGTRNEYGELQGLPRLKEALEANSWASSRRPLAEALEDSMGKSDEGSVDDDEDAIFKHSASADEIEREMMGLHFSVRGEDGEDGEDGEGGEVEKLESTLLRLQAVRDMGADLPMHERRKVAAKAVEEVMKTL
ncbi:MAG: hypothetical protein M1834_005478 [Cirrosporium novae-zelandiae]|nr:MAG: hypothetical protein M1834_005478 [Cirrosporium novae-zelandiae]